MTKSMLEAQPPKCFKLDHKDLPADSTYVQPRIHGLNKVYALGDKVRFRSNSQNREKIKRNMDYRGLTVRTVIIYPPSAKSNPPDLIDAEADMMVDNKF